jgi:hypothetical protein
MKKLPVAEHLNDYEYKLLLKVYAEHNRSMGMDERKKYTLSDIIKVERDQLNKRLKVYYKNGDWWYYSSDMTWS